MAAVVRVLVVEDEPNSRHALEECLRLRGYVVEGAANASQAIGVGRRFEPDVAICDWLLGAGPDGVDLARRLSEDNPALKILLVSGMGPEALSHVRLRVPAVRAVLRKPLDVGELCTTVDAITDDAD